jgi:hypothetical protein
MDSVDYGNISIEIHNSFLFQAVSNATCSFGLCDLDVQFTGSVNVFQKLPIMLTKIH